MKKNLIWILVGILILALAGLFFYFYKSGTIKPQAEGEVATLSLDPTSGTYNVNDTFNVDIKLDTGGAAVDGVDLRYLRYDPQILEVQDADTATPGTQISAKSSAFTEVKTNDVNAAIGTISFSLIVPTGAAGFTGSETIAGISFKAKSGSSAANVSFDFQLGDPNDANVASAGVDILASVTNGSYTINGAPPPPPALPTVNLKANDSDGPIEINSGTAATLSWIATPGGATCTATGGWTGTKALTGSESTGNLTQAKNFTLTCVNVTGSATDSVTVNVKDVTPLPDVTLKANNQREATIEAGGSVTLTWTTRSADACEASGSWSGDKPVAGVLEIDSINEPKTYILTCTNAVGSVHDRAMVLIENLPTPPILPTVDIKANNSNDPITVNYSSDATLSWTSSNADTCVASNGWSGDKAVSGTESTGNLTASKTYTLTCKKGETSAIDSVTVNVTGELPAAPGPSDGNQVSDQPTTATVAQLPDAVTPTPKPTAKTQEFYKGGVNKPWAMWLFYTLIPLSLTAAIIYFYLRRKRAKTDLPPDNLKDFPSDWPNS